MIFAIGFIFSIATCSLLISLLLLNKYNREKYKFHSYANAKRMFKRRGLNKGIVAFGSSRLKANDEDYKEIEEISQLCAERIIKKHKRISFISGGGSGVMCAWLKQAYKLGCQTAGFCLKLPKEQKTNDYCRISYNFTNLAARKQCFFDFALCYVVFKGGFGTADELFNLLCLMQNKKVEKKPIFVYPASFYRNVFNFDSLVKKGTIDKSDADLLTFCDTKEDLLKKLYKIIDND